VNAEAAEDFRILDVVGTNHVTFDRCKQRRQTLDGFIFSTADCGFSSADLLDDHPNIGH